MAKIALQEIGQIHLTVEDLPRTVAFYRDVMGMQLLFEVVDQSMAFFDCGGIRLCFGPNEGLDQPSSPLIYYRVDDITGSCEELERQGVALDGPAHVVHRTDTMELWMAFFDDPEGHKVALMEELTVTPS